MVFGKRPVVALRAAETVVSQRDDGRSGSRAAFGRVRPGTRGRVAITALAGAILGFGGVAAGTTFVHASERAGLFGFFEDIFRPAPPSAPVAARPTRKRYVSLPDSRRLVAPRERRFTPRPVAALPAVTPPRSARPATGARTAVATVATGTQTVCVRTCDGYLFPLGRLGSQGDLPVHRSACAAACPNAPTALFKLPAGRTELDQAVSLKGQPYLAAAWANVYRQKRVQNCSCQQPGVAAVPYPVHRDATVRVGDIVTTASSADIVTKLARGKITVADYREAPGVSRRTRRDIDQRVGAMQRDAADIAFHRSLRIAEARADRVRLAEAGVARLRMREAGTHAGETPDASNGRQASAPIRVVSQSFYGR